ncbi:hypothetical protein UY3_13616 [Chelonia mydas]|uniref:Uncharacterized protein n=1 Tax=Chelonia mydas TaxID=8469 RepID=M7BAU0_CHEMY|nr:hypothetical protein UY3_13616 [Chelonia mydas]
MEPTQVPLKGKDDKRPNRRDESEDAVDYCRPGEQMPDTEAVQCWVWLQGSALVQPIVAPTGQSLLFQANGGCGKRCGPRVLALAGHVPKVADSCFIVTIFSLKPSPVDMLSPYWGTCSSHPIKGHFTNINEFSFAIPYGRGGAEKKYFSPNIIDSSGLGNWRAENLTGVFECGIFDSTGI